jgi:hypothetical protein
LHAKLKGTFRLSSNSANFKAHSNKQLVKVNIGFRTAAFAVDVTLRNSRYSPARESVAVLIAPG